MMRRSCLLLILLSVAVEADYYVASGDGLGRVDEECVDLAEAGTMQCQQWALNGEWYGYDRLHGRRLV
jgi:hypothetical protein